MDGYQIPWRWPWCEHLSKMKIFWKHSAIFLSHAFATKFIMNSNETPSAAFHTKGQLHVHFPGTCRRDYHGAVGHAKKGICLSIFELIKLLSITETLLLLTPTWKMKCSEAFPSLETGAPRGEVEKRGFGAPTASSFAPVPGLCTQPLLNIWGL